MFFRMFRQSVFQGRRRKILAAFTVGLAAALGMALVVLSVGVGDRMAQELRSYGSNIRVAPRSESLSLSVGGVDLNPLKGRDTLDEADLPRIKDIFWRNNIIGLAPFLKTTVEVSGGASGGVPLIGSYFHHEIPIEDGDAFIAGVRTVASHWTVRGDWPDEADPAGVLVGAALAQRLGVGPGARLSAAAPGGGARALHVVGVVSSGGEEDGAIVAPLALAQEFAGLPGRVQWVDVSALTVPENDLSRRAHKDAESLTAAEYDVWYCTAYVSSIAHQIEEAVVDASARPIWRVAAGEGAVIGKMQTLLIVVTLAAFASAAMGVSALIGATVNERAREIGLMKALGAAALEIHLLFLAEAAAVGLAGGIAGCAAGAALAQAVGRMVFGQGLAVPWIAAPLVTLAAMIVALLGAAVPARTIARLAPVEVLYGRR